MPCTAGVVSTARWEISLKGAGKTPFSRRADGRAVLRSLCRELLGSAALQALGVPTTRSLAVIGADVLHDGIHRDELFTGNTTLSNANLYM